METDSCPRSKSDKLRAPATQPVSVSFGAEGGGGQDRRESADRQETEQKLPHLRDRVSDVRS